MLSILSDRQAAYQLGQSDEVKIQFETWCAIFGCGAAKLPFLLQSQINAIVGRAQYVSSKSHLWPGLKFCITHKYAAAFTTLDARVTNSETLNNEFYCSDSWLTATDPAGNPFRDANGNVDASYFWDNRPTRPNEILDGWVDIANDKCDSDTMGFTIAEMWGYKGDVITHCADMFTNIWNPAQAAGQTIEQLCATKYNAGSNPSFDSLVRDKLARSFVHELMHSINAVGLRKVVDGFAYTEIGRYPHNTSKQMECYYKRFCTMSVANLRGLNQMIKSARTPMPWHMGGNVL